MSATGISVIICCYNSADRLPETLKHLAIQVVPPEIQWEIIVIDNASTDDTAMIAAIECDKYPSIAHRYKILDEPVPGKNYAFEKGINESAYDLILTCDDDNWLNYNYVETCFNIMQSDISIGALGGTGEFEPEQPAEPLIIPFKNNFVNGEQHWAKTDHWVYGAGSVYRKKIFTDLKKLSWQQITSGRLGTKLISGEDVEICFMFYLLGYKIVASNSLLFKHFVPKKRQDLKYVLRMAYWSGYTNVLLSGYYHIIQQKNAPLEQFVNEWLKDVLTRSIKFQILITYRSLIKRQKLTTQDQITLLNLRGIVSGLIFKRKKVIKHYQHLKTILADRQIVC